MKRNNGFTLMELLVVIAIIIILAGAIIARIGTSGEKAKKAKAMAELDEIASGCRGFYADTGLWPKTEADLTATSAPAHGYDEKGGEQDITVSDWKGPYLEKDTLEDPWKENYTVVKTADDILEASCSETTVVEPVTIHRFSP